MPASFILNLDTTGPQGAAIVLNGNATYASTPSVTAAFSTSDGSTVGYQIKVWGNVDTTASASVKDTEANSSWQSWTPTLAIQLSAGDGLKTVSAKIRDDVWNESAIVSDTITLDTSVPVITLGAPDVTKVSKIAGKRVAAAAFSTSEALVAYEVRVVPSTSSLRTAGTLIGAANGSTNMSGGAVAESGTVNITIDGRDLEAASTGDGAKIVKVFGQDASGNWSV